MTTTQPPATVTETPTTATEWADALDILTADARTSGISLSEWVSEGYSRGTLADVGLSYDDPRIDNESPTLVSDDGRWVVYYEPSTGLWYVDEDAD
jgi:hypothetical protein